MTLTLTDDGFQLVGQRFDFHIREEDDGYVVDCFDVNKINNDDGYLSSSTHWELDEAIKWAFDLEKNPQTL